MRKLFSILLLAMFTLPLLSPLLAFGADAGLPACCRRTGKHHCMMSMGEGPRHGSPAFSLPPEKCPCCPGVLPATHPNPLSAPPAGAIYAALVSHPAAVAQTESKRRIARDRSRQKRGPPLRSPQAI